MDPKTIKFRILEVKPKRWLRDYFFAPLSWENWKALIEYNGKKFWTTVDVKERKERIIEHIQYAIYFKMGYYEEDKRKDFEEQLQKAAQLVGLST